MVNEWTGAIFRHYPTVEEIIERLPVNRNEAEWMYWACCFKVASVRLVLINDMARAVLAGCPINNSLWQHAAMISMLAAPLWERER